MQLPIPNWCLQLGMLVVWKKTKIEKKIWAFGVFEGKFCLFSV